MELLQKLRAGDPESWDEVYRRLHPVAYEAARSRLGNDFRTECEDIAVETLGEILRKGADVESEDGLKPLAVAIARNKATDRLRRFLAAKRGGNKVQSLDALPESGPGGESPEDFLDHLTARELRDLLISLSEEVKKEYRIVLGDHYFEHLSHSEIAEKRRIAVGSVGVYVQRGLAAMRAAIRRRPKMKAELIELIGDAGIVRVLLPLLSAIQIGGWFFEHLTQGCLAQIDESRLSDEERLRLSPENLVGEVCLPETQRTALMELTREKYPHQFQAWELRKAAERKRMVAAEAVWRQRSARLLARRRLVIYLLCSALLGAAVLTVFLLLKR